jgi:hypothetical protein
MKTILRFFMFIILFSSCKETDIPTQKETPEHVKYEGKKIKGLSFVAPPRPFNDNPMHEVEDLGSNWISVIPYAFTRLNEPNLIYNSHGKQWWGERPEGIQKTIELAHEKGIKVMVKPQVWIPRGWTGDLDFKEEEWKLWEQGYRDYILEFAKMAKDEEVDLFCIGTEFRTSIKNRPEFWLALIKEVRKTYPGKITYAANWDDYQKVPFWNELDFIGINAYFPLIEKEEAKPVEICKAWKPWLTDLEAFMAKQSKPLLFTEYGYLSVDKCTWKTWEIEKQIHEYPINQAAQANAYQALFDTFWNKSYWAGGFLWKWFPEMKGHEGYPEKDYTPQGKEAEGVVREWFSR